MVAKVESLVDQACEGLEGHSAAALISVSDGQEFLLTHAERERERGACVAEIKRLRALRVAYADGSDEADVQDNQDEVWNVATAAQAEDEMRRTSGSIGCRCTSEGTVSSEQ